MPAVRPSGRRGLAAGLAGGLACVVLLSCAVPGGEALRRGDRLLAQGRPEEAIAEYKLARRQAGDEPEILLRLGHAYAGLGEVDDALRYFEALLERDSSHLYQVASDLVAAARDARERGARETMVRALQPLSRTGLGLIPEDLRLALARYHWEDSEYGQALPLYLSILSDGADGGLPDTADGAGRDTASLPPAVLYETARAYEELGGCSESLRYFEGYLERVADDAPERAGARWHYGNCLFATAEAERAAGHPRSALQKLDRMVELGVPQTLLDRAHFLRGELLLALGNADAALEAYRQVLRLNPSRSGLLVRRAEDRIRGILYGRR